MQKSKSKRQSNRVKIAILLSDGFEESEMTKPREALKKAGVIPVIISPKGKKAKSWRHGNWSKTYKVDLNLKNTNPSDYDGLLLPGGVINPDTLRKDKNAVKFVQHFMQRKKPIAAICHGPWTLIETKKLKDRKLTSYQSIKSDLINAGVKWQNKKVVRDKNLVTSRFPDDLPAFNKAIIKLFKVQK